MARKNISRGKNRQLTDFSYLLDKSEENKECPEGNVDKGENNDIEKDE